MTPRAWFVLGMGAGAVLMQGCPAVARLLAHESLFYPKETR